ncbi:hypothetical protein [Streptomyces sp. WAC04114]|uniref:hypothetical protein n=1 Tax=Streptomyces sp. WAC04114 TaxID=2867961 RepID=UPI0021AB1E82|nr:hypothetical protein [Streptomyces sp. WAC04114]
MPVVFATATPAHATDTTPDTRATTTAPARGADPAPDAQAAYLADRLRESPVHVTDQLPRELPPSTAPDFARLAKKTGVPTYVLVLPMMSSTEGDQLLGAVHDRLGRDGLYVLIEGTAVARATAYGVRAPAEAAVTVTVYELAYDAGALASFERFVEVIAQGEKKAAARAEAARERYGDDEPAEMYIGPSDRQNQSFLTGILLTGVPLSILLLAAYARRGRTGKPALRLIVPGVALLSAAAIALTAPVVFDETRSSAARPPTPAEMSARVERVAAGLKQDPVYADPESPRVLDARQLDRLHERIRDFRRSDGGGPVYVSLVPQTPESEAAGDADLFAAAVHAKVGEDGVYVVADPDDGTIDVLNHGLRLDSSHLSFDLPDSLTLGDGRADEADDHLLGERLDRLMTFLDETPRTDRPRGPSAGEPRRRPRSDRARSRWSTGPGGCARRRSPVPESFDRMPITAPTAPSTSYLRRTAYNELIALSAEFDPEDHARDRERLDTALLLVDGDPGRARRPGVDPTTLVAVIVLARAGRAALTGRPSKLCCGVNPLHGPAEHRHHVRVTADGNRRRLLPVCAPCHDVAVAEPGGIPGRLLKLPGPALGNTRLPYYDITDSPLTAVPDGVGRLVDRVRGAAGVH